MSEEKESYELLENNANAVRSLLKAVEGTIGPKGLDTMLVDQFGDVIITNDGITILELMEVKHPVIKMLINAVRSQQKEAGDGTTTTALMAGELILSGIEQVEKGVPVAQVIKGMRQGVASACTHLRAQGFPADQAMLEGIATIAAREYDDIARLIVEAAQTVGKEKLAQPTYRLANSVRAAVGAEGGVFNGIILSKNRLNKQMPKELNGALKVLVVDDSLEAESFDEETLTTESGFQAYLAQKQEFRDHLAKVIASGANVVLVDRGIDEEAEEILTAAGILALARIPHKELELAAEHLGARLLKKSSLKRSIEELQQALGSATQIIDDEKLGHLCIYGGPNPTATILIGAATDEIVGERERIAKDAAASVQAAILHGVIAGGGAAELAAAKALEQERNSLQGMSAFGMDCVINALRRPFMQIVKNAGFNPLEKVGDVNQAQEQGGNHLAIDCDSGQIADMLEQRIVDSLFVKEHGLKVAGEVAEAILRINIIIKKKEYRP